MQTYSDGNSEMRVTGKMTEVFLATGKTATSSSFAVLFDEFDYKGNEPDIIDIQEGLGTRSSNVSRQISKNHFKVSFAAYIGVNKLPEFLYLATGGTPTITQDGSTGAYKWEMFHLNNTELPACTAFLNVDPIAGLDDTGWRRLTGGKVDELTIEDGGEDFKVSGSFIFEDDSHYINTASTVSPTNITAIAYQATTGLTRYTFGTTDLSTVSNGDILDVSGVTGITNATNEGVYVIENVSDASDYVEVFNRQRTSDTDDETGLTATGSAINVINRAVYTDDIYVGSRTGKLYTAPSAGGLDSASSTGLESMSFGINNTHQEYYLAGTRSSSDIIAKNIEASLEFTQLAGTTEAQNLNDDKTCNGVERAWRLDYEDTCQTLGTSTTYYPKVRIEVPHGLGIGTSSNVMTHDNVMIDWAVNTSKEQDITYEIYNERSALFT